MKRPAEVYTPKKCTRCKVCRTSISLSTTATSSLPPAAAFLLALKNRSHIYCPGSNRCLGLNQTLTLAHLRKGHHRPIKVISRISRSYPHGLAVSHAAPRQPRQQPATTSGRRAVPHDVGRALCRIAREHPAKRAAASDHSLRRINFWTGAIGRKLASSWASSRSSKPSPAIPTLTHGTPTVSAATYRPIRTRACDLLSLANEGADKWSLKTWNAKSGDVTPTRGPLAIQCGA